MDEFAMDASVTYQDLEPMIEAEVYDPLPDGLVDQDWLELPEIEQEWLQTIDQGEPELSLDVSDLEQGFDLEH